MPQWWRRCGARALPLLEAAVAARPDDVCALESYGESPGPAGPARRRAGRLQEAPLPRADPPNRARRGCSTGLDGQAHKDAIDFWKRAIAINPWRSDYYAGLARAAVQTRDWSVAAEACQKALHLNPTLLDVRKWLVQCDLHRGKRDAARSELDTLLGFDPPDRADLLRRFATVAKER